MAQPATDLTHTGPTWPRTGTPVDGTLITAQSDRSVEEFTSTVADAPSPVILDPQDGRGNRFYRGGPLGPATTPQAGQLLKNNPRFRPPLEACLRFGETLLTQRPIAANLATSPNRNRGPGTIGWNAAITANGDRPRLNDFQPRQESSAVSLTRKLPRQ
ncbi:hypothetical protein [Nocardia noduli]|uniref:hypothetical protein n=1 Tax=Nocardia noduli TaxID=2815722 RepID=UPI001C218777|nr:hypothetical protein [Nocardia noduli]